MTIELQGLLERLVRLLDAVPSVATSSGDE